MDNQQIPLIDFDKGGGEGDLRKLLNQHLSPEYQTQQQPQPDDHFKYIQQLQEIMTNWEQHAGKLLLEKWGNKEEALAALYSGIVNDFNAKVDRDARRY